MAASNAGAGRAPHPDIPAILEDYADFTLRLGLSYHSRYERMRGARALLARLDGLDWHSPTVAAALEGLQQRENSFVSFLLLHGHLRPSYPTYSRTIRSSYDKRHTRPTRRTSLQ